MDKKYYQYTRGIQLKSNSKRAVLYFHGFFSTPGEAYFLGQYLHERGFDFYAYLYPFHGETFEVLDKADYQVWLNFAKEKYEDLKKQYEKVDIIGFSMGGALTLYLAENFCDINSLVLLAPAVLHRHRITHCTAIAKPFVKSVAFFSMPSFKGETEKYLYDGIERVSVSAAHELNKIMKIVRKNMSKVSTPFIYIQGEDDDVISTKSKDYVFKRVKSNIKSFIFFKNMKHLVPVENDKEQVFEKVYQFLITR